MYAKVLKQDLYCGVYIYNYSGNVWLPYNKYGEKLPTQNSIYSEVTNETMIKWVADKDVNIELGSPKFETQIKYPLVAESRLHIWVMQDEYNGISINKSTDKISPPYNTTKQLLEDKELKILEGRERDLVLYGLNLKELIARLY